MSDKLFTPFFEATRNVLQLMLSIDEVENRPLEQDASFLDSLSVSIGVIGDLSGQVVYRFPKETSLSIVSAMSGMEVDEVDDFVTSAVSEIANIISGNVMTMLSDSELTCDILPPLLITEEADKSRFGMVTESCIITSLGNICLDIMLSPA